MFYDCTQGEANLTATGVFEASASVLISAGRFPGVLLISCVQFRSGAYTVPIFLLSLKGLAG